MPTASSATLFARPFSGAFRVAARCAVYFEAAAVIISLTLFGQVMELKAAPKPAPPSRRCWARAQDRAAPDTTTAARKMSR
jgi:cation transport ATPase